jgi:hypothetical protein
VSGLKFFHISGGERKAELEKLFARRMEYVVSLAVLESRGSREFLKTCECPSSIRKKLLLTTVTCRLRSFKVQRNPFLGQSAQPLDFSNGNVKKATKVHKSILLTRSRKKNLEDSGSSTLSDDDLVTVHSQTVLFHLRSLCFERAHNNPLVLQGERVTSRRLV